MYLFTIAPWVYVIVSSFNELFFSNFTLVLLPSYFNAGERLLSSIAGGLITSLDSALDFQSEIWLILLIFLKYLLNAWNTK